MVNEVNKFVYVETIRTGLFIIASVNIPLGNIKTDYNRACFLKVYKRTRNINEKKARKTFAIIMF